MKGIYNKESDIIIIRFSNEPVEESDSEKPGIILDYDKDGNIVSIEILNASKKMPQPAQFEYVIA
jgi:uncharacterized protein YuzE